MAEVGYVSVVVALVLALYGAIAGPVGVKLRWAHLVRTAQYVVPMQFVLVTAAALALVYALIANDFTMKYVVFNTTRATPFYYKITGLWGRWKAPSCSGSGSWRSSRSWSCGAIDGKTRISSPMSCPFCLGSRRFSSRWPPS